MLQDADGVIAPSSSEGPAFCKCCCETAQTAEPKPIDVEVVAAEAVEAKEGRIRTE